MAYHLTCHNCQLDHTVDVDEGLAKFGTHQTNYPTHHPTLIKDEIKT